MVLFLLKHNTNIMQLLLKRKYKKPEYTIGQLYYIDKRDNAIYICDTIEDTDRNLCDSMALYDIKQKKVYGKTAIPYGLYDIELTYSPKFANRKWCKKYKGLVPEIMNVKGWEGVRLHVGNSAEELLGCCAVGFNKKVGKVLDSTLCYYNLMDNYIIPAINRKEKIYLMLIG